MRVSVLLAFLLALGPLAGGAGAQTRHKGAQQQKAQPVPHYVAREKANENLLMVLGGTLGGPYIQMAQDIALTVSDGDNLRVLPIAGDGAMKNVRDVLLLRGVDLAITTDQVLNSLKASGEHGPNLERRIAYISPLAVDMLHVLVRPEINSLKDLHGKKLNVMPKGSASSVLVPRTLKGLGIVVDEVNLTIADAVQQMRAGKIVGTACYCPVPVPAFTSLGADLGFKFMEVPYVTALEEASFLPASLPSELYPNLTTKGSNVQTVATMTILITFNWSPGSDRYRKIEKFVHAFFTNFDKLRQPPRHPAWRSVNMAAGVRGWQRFPAAQQWLDRQAAEAKAKAKAKAKTAVPSGIDVTQARAQAAKAAPHDAAEQERLFKEFLEWSSKRPRR
jgi:TRAP transporter TAXI family solute receptor